MEKDNNHGPGSGQPLDDLFRISLEGQRVEPPKTLWKGINRKLLLKEITRLNFSNLSRTFWIGGSATLAVVGMLTYFLFSAGDGGQGSEIGGQKSEDGGLRSEVGGQKPGARGQATVAESRDFQDKAVTGSQSHKVTKSSSQQVNKSSSQQVSKSSSQQVSKSSSQQVSKSSSQQVNKSSSQQVIESTSHQTQESTSRVMGSTVKPIVASGNQQVDNSIIQQPSESINETSNTTPNSIAEQANQQVSNSATQQLPGSAEQQPPDSPPRQFTTVIPAEAGKPPKPTSGSQPFVATSALPGKGKAIQQHFSVDLGITPELSFYRGSSSYSKWNYWVGADFAYHLGRFSIRPGISFGYMNDDGVYGVDYKRNDSIGYFFEVVSYQVNPYDSGQLVFNTITKTVYDSILHSGEEAASYRYQYWQFPLMIGFDIVRMEHFTLSVQAGPAVSMLVREKEVTTTPLDLNSARLVSRTNETPARVQTNWQLWGAIHLGYVINREFSLFAEPTFKFYLNPASEAVGGTSKAPWAIGMQIGVQYSFGRKNEE